MEADMPEWVWPVPIFNGGRPVVSSPFGPQERVGGHWGSDICYPRERKGEWRLPEMTPLYMMPSMTVDAIAIGSGTVVRAGVSATGGFVEIDHGSAFGISRMTSLYRHLESARVRVGERVIAGTRLGFIGHDPRNPKGFNHLHFEIWDKSRRVRNLDRRDKVHGIDPETVLSQFDYVDHSGDFQRGNGETGVGPQRRQGGHRGDDLGDARSVAGTIVGGVADVGGLGL